MGDLTDKLTLWNRIKIFDETEIVQLSAITTEWLYPRKHCWKRLSDSDKIKFYQHLYHCKRKKYNKNIKTFDWLVLENNEIYLGIILCASVCRIFWS